MLLLPALGIIPSHDAAIEKRGGIAGAPNRTFDIFPVTAETGVIPG
jgi:hypothetical protein